MADDDSSKGKGKNPMEEILEKLSATEVLMLMRAFSVASAERAPQPQLVKLDLPPVELKLDGPATYLSWSRRVKRALSGRNLEGYLTGEKGEPARDSAGHNEWKTTNSLLHTWLLNSMVASIAVTVDGIETVSDVWGKLQRIYAGVNNNMRVFQIEREIKALVQRERSIQEYAADLERLWTNYDHFSPVACCRDPECKEGDERVQRRTMHFLRGLNPAFEPRCAVLLAQPRIPSLDEAISAMIQEESRMRLQAGASVALIPCSFQALCILNFDGGAKGNPGKGGAGALLKTEDGRVICRLSEGLGVVTNNVAEYKALLIGLRYALIKGFKRIDVRGDSMLVVMQVQGKWKVKHKDMIELCKKVNEVKKSFTYFNIQHVRREFNSDADHQANLAIDLRDGQVSEVLGDGC